MATEGCFDDYWQLLPNRPPPDPGDAAATSVLLEAIENIEPLDAQLGVYPKKSVPDALHVAFFGQPVPSDAELDAARGDPAALPPMQTYTILDAATVANLPEMLESSGLEHRCLFKGPALEELKNVAPWLVRLEEGNAFTRSLFTVSEASWQ